MDYSFEQTIRHNEDKGDKYKYYFLYTMTFLFGFGAFYGILQLLAGSIIIGLIQIILCAGLALYSFIYKEYMLVEFDYALYEDDINFAKVINLKKRKEMLSVNTECLVSLAPIANQRFTELKKMQGIKIYNFTLNSEDLHFFIYAEQGGEKLLVIFEPNEELIKKLKQKKPSIARL